MVKFIGEDSIKLLNVIWTLGWEEIASHNCQDHLC